MHIIPSYNFSHRPLSGRLHTAHRRSNPRAAPQHSTTYDTLHEIFLQHITLPHVPLRGSYCTRSTFPHSERHDTRALHPYKADIACNGYSLTATPSPWHHTTNWHLTIRSALTDPTIEAPIGHLAWDLPIPDALSPFGEPQSYFKAVSQHALRAYILYIGNTPLNYPSKPSTLVAS